MRAWVAAHWFGLGVAALAAAAAGVPLPPAARLAAARGRGAAALRRPPPARRAVPGRARGARRRAAPLPRSPGRSRTSGFGLEGLRALSALFAVASIPVVALLAARLAGRVPALIATVIVASSWTFLFHGVYGRMYSLFLLHERALVPRRCCARSSAADAARVGALGARDPRDGRDAPVRRARARLAGASSSSSPAATGCARRSGPSAPSRVLGIPFWLTDLVLAGRFDAGVAGGGRIDLVEYVWHAAGDFTAGFPVLPAVLVAAAAGVAVLPRETRLLAACAAGGAAARARRRAQLGLAGDAAPDLPPPLPRAGGRARA